MVGKPISIKQSEMIQLQYVTILLLRYANLITNIATETIELKQTLNTQDLMYEADEVLFSCG